MNTHTGPGGVTYLHAVEVRGGSVDHHPDPAPVTEISDPLTEANSGGETDRSTFARTEPVIEVEDIAGLGQARDGVECRLATAAYAPHTTCIRRLRLRFPTGDERSYPTDEITRCTRDDDHAALVTALTRACRSLRDACRIARDRDEALRVEVFCLAMTICGIADIWLGLQLDPDSLDSSATDARADGVSPKAFTTTAGNGSGSTTSRHSTPRTWPRNAPS